MSRLANKLLVAAAAGSALLCFWSTTRFPWSPAAGAARTAVADDAEARKAHEQAAHMALAEDREWYSGLDREFRNSIRSAIEGGDLAPISDPLEFEVGLLADADCIPVIMLDCRGRSVIMLSRRSCENLFAFIDKLRAKHQSKAGGLRDGACYLSVSSLTAVPAGAVLYACQPWVGIPVFYYQYHLADEIQDAVIFRHRGDVTIHMDSRTGLRVSDGWSSVDDIGADTTQVTGALGLQSHEDVLTFRYLELGAVQTTRAR